MELWHRLPMPTTEQQQALPDRMACRYLRSIYPNAYPPLSDAALLTFVRGLLHHGT
jgi:hypothetical protein